MKRPNGAGGVRKLPGRRRKPYQAVVTDGMKWTGTKFIQNQVSLGVYRTRAEALDALADFRMNPINLEGRNLTFENVYELIKDNFKESMKNPLRSSFRQLYPIIGKKKVADIRKRELDMVAVALADKSASTQNNAKILISRVFKYAMENDYINKDYSQYMTFLETADPHEKTSLSVKEVQKVLGAEDPLTTYLLYTGMRISELLDMKSRDVYEEDGILCFHVTKSKTKNGVRIIPVHSDIIGSLELKGDYVLHPHSNITYRRQDFRSLMAELNIKGHTPHDLRRTFSTFAKRSGMDDFYRRSLMGHSQLNLTDEVYTDAFVSDLKAQMELLRFQ